MVWARWRSRGPKTGDKGKHQETWWPAIVLADLGHQSTPSADVLIEFLGENKAAKVKAADVQSYEQEFEARALALCKASAAKSVPGFKHEFARCAVYEMLAAMWADAADPDPEMGERVRCHRPLTIQKFIFVAGNLIKMSSWKWAPDSVMPDKNKHKDSAALAPVLATWGSLAELEALLHSGLEQTPAALPAGVDVNSAECLLQAVRCTKLLTQHSGGRIESVCCCCETLAAMILAISAFCRTAEACQNGNLALKALPLLAQHKSNKHGCFCTNPLPLVSAGLVASDRPGTWKAFLAPGAGAKMELGVFQTCLSAVKAYTNMAMSHYTSGLPQGGKGKKRASEDARGHVDDEDAKKPRVEDPATASVQEWCAEVNDAMQLLWSKVTVPVDNGNKIGTSVGELLSSLTDIYENSDGSASTTRKSLIKTDFYGAHEAAALCFSSDGVNSTDSEVQMAAFLQGLECAQRIQDVKTPIADLREKQEQHSQKLSSNEQAAGERQAQFETQTATSLGEVEAGISSGQAALTLTLTLTLTHLLRAGGAQGAPGGRGAAHESIEARPG